jgi:response regulator of citrate/malate metabolism
LIRTLVVDDDYRVAKVHAAGVAAIEGFSCVGEAHSSSEARELVGARQPDLLLVDLYLPDENGLELVRSLGEQRLPTQPDFIVITAARDVESVRRAMQLGAIHYLIKPFGFAQLRDQLIAYRRLREGLGQTSIADQETVDALYGLLRHPPTGRTTRPGPTTTVAQVLNAVRAAADGVSAADVAHQLGFSRATAQRYLADLVRRGHVEVSPNYGGAGRPENRYRISRPT